MLDHRLAQAVRIFMQIFQSYALGTEVTGAKDIRRVPADALDAALSHSYFKAATSFTEWANPMMDGLLFFLAHGIPSWTA
jgi:hypothetical protein